MEFVADILLVAGAIGAGFYCYILSRKLSKFNDLEQGVGGAVALLSNQVDSLSRSLLDAQNASGESGEALADLTMRAEAVASRLELMMASMHDLPTGKNTPSETREDQAAQPANELQENAGPMFVRHERGGGKAAR